MRTRQYIGCHREAIHITIASLARWFLQRTFRLGTSARAMASIGHRARTPRKHRRGRPLPQSRPSTRVMALGWTPLSRLSFGRAMCAAGRHGRLCARAPPASSPIRPTPSIPCAARLPSRGRPSPYVCGSRKMGRGRLCGIDGFRGAATWKTGGAFTSGTCSPRAPSTRQAAPARSGSRCRKALCDTTCTTVANAPTIGTRTTAKSASASTLGRAITF
jgi:hypothetical protein